MHQTSTPIVARFTFTPERAEEFLADKDEHGDLVYSGRLVTQEEYETIDEIMDDLRMFGDAVIDCSAIVGGQVVSLSDHSEA